MTQETKLQALLREIKPYQQKLINHTIYGSVQNAEDLKLFMQSHIYAVWDFMSLLKYLQLKLTCVSVPWVPKGDPETRYLINEIVCDEECDANQFGIRMSHFELYLTAMKKIGADTTEVEKFIDLISNDLVEPALALTKVQAAIQVKQFVRSTFDFINLDKPYIAAAVFTFGREDLIPGMFISFVNQLYKDEPDKYSIFKYYLERHIEVDGDHHAILAHKMTAILCGDDDTKWDDAITAVKQALQARIDFWDGIQNHILTIKTTKEMNAHAITK
jgi:hypothetical protein